MERGNRNAEWKRKLPIVLRWFCVLTIIASVTQYFSSPHFIFPFTYPSLLSEVQQISTKPLLSFLTIRRSRGTINLLRPFNKIFISHWRVATADVYLLFYERANTHGQRRISFMARGNSLLYRRRNGFHGDVRRRDDDARDRAYSPAIGSAFASHPFLI